MNDSNSTNREQIVIVGVSARAAAQSAIRAGYSVIAVDAFADADLQAIARVIQVENYPDDLVPVIEKLAAEFPDKKPRAMYTGALENHLDAIDALEKNFRLIGNGREVVGRTRNPFLIQIHLADAGLPTLQILDGTEPPISGTWMRKPFRSAGGIGATMFDGVAVVGRSSPPESLRQNDNETTGANDRSAQRTLQHTDCFFQEFKAGDAISAVFWTDDENTKLIGVTQQLVGRVEVHAAPFAYCGSIGPLRLPDERETRIRDIGNSLANAFQLQGLFNVDFIDDGENFFTLEINPRYSASVEILERNIASPSRGRVETEERGFGEGKVGLERFWLRTASNPSHPTKKDTHRVAAGAPRSGGPRNEAAISRVPLASPVPSNQSHGKLILFADREYHFPSDWDWSRFGESVADLPTPGTTIQPGHPICTVFAAGTSVEDCEQQLFEQAGQTYGEFRTSGNTVGHR